MKKEVIFFLFVLILAGLVYAVPAYNNLHLNIQTTYSNGTIQIGTFAFIFNITNTSNDCSNQNIVYSYSVTNTTDSRGIVSIYLPNVTLDYTQQYWLCYYRDGVLSSIVQLARTPSTFAATNVSLSGVAINTNLNLANQYNITNVNYGFFNFLGIGISNPLYSKLNIFASGNDSYTELQPNGLQIFSGTTSSDYALYMGVDTTNDNAYIESVNWGVAVAPLILQPRGGKVGIGTTNPATPLEVDGVSATGGAGIRLNYTASGYGMIGAAGNMHVTQNAYYNGTGWYSIQAGYANIIQTNTQFPLYIQTNSTPVTAANQPITFSSPFSINNGGIVSGIYTEVSCTPNTATYDCACPAGYMALGGGGYANGGQGIRESTPYSTGGGWEMTCITPTGTYGSVWADTPCAKMYVQCLKVA